MICLDQSEREGDGKQQTVFTVSVLIVFSIILLHTVRTLHDDNNTIFCVLCVNALSDR